MNQNKKIQIILSFFCLIVLSVLFLNCSQQTTGNSPSITNPNINSWTTAVETITTNASSSASPATASATHTDLFYFAPFNFTTILQNTYTPTGLLTASAFTTRTRFMIKGSTGNYLNIGNSGLTTASALTVNYKDTLSKIFETIADANQPTWFRIDSELHSLFSLDTDTSGNVSFLNNYGSALAPASRGYVVFSYDNVTKLIQAKARYTYNLSTLTHLSTADAVFTNANYYLQENLGVYKLVVSSGSATQFTIYQSPIATAMPFDFNPNLISYQINPSVLIASYISNTTTGVEGPSGKVRQNLSATYLTQVAAIGDDSGTSAAATTILNTIETTLTSEGATLRYSKNLYLAFRKALLNQILQSDNTANGTLGMNTAPYVYFTNESDGLVHHPFMVIASYSVADKPNRLLDVFRPPGDGTTSGYASQSVTRDSTLQVYLVKIPLKNYGLVSSGLENTMLATLNSDAGYPGSNNAYVYASLSAVAMAADGVVIYPTYNNTLVPAQSVAEVTTSGIHVGQGMGLHYHADGHSTLSNDLTLYNIHDYVGQSHPPVIGFAFDGIAIFGIYESSYSSMEGYGTALDEFGGHTHGVLGYHYHSHKALTTTSTGTSYSLHILLKGAWKGKINSIPEFWDTTKNEPAYALSQRHKYVGKP
jgi:hypothetical protein